LLTAAILMVSVRVASADTVILTSGTVSLYWDGSLSGFQVSGSGTQLNGEVLQAAPGSLGANATADLSGTVRTTLFSNHPSSETVNGTSYPSVWVKGAFTFTARSFVPPDAADGTVRSFSTPFTMQGQFSGYADQTMANQVFGVALQASGVATIGPMRFDSSGNAWALAGSGGVSYTLSGPLPDPWTSTDIGNVGVAGIASYAGGVFYVAGAGADVWGTADAFQFVSQPLDGDGTIIARVDGEQNTSPYAKAGIMIRQSLDPGSAQVILDVKPNGGIEFMARSPSGAPTTFIGGGGSVLPFPVSLKLTRVTGTVESLITGFAYDPVSAAWIQVGWTKIQITPEALVGLAVTSHDTTALNTAVFDTIQVARNLLDEGGFEGYIPPALGTPGWVSDNPLRQIPAKSETNQPHSGAKNGACWATTAQDCGIYQEVTSPADGIYALTLYANADRSGGLLGVNVNGITVASVPVDVRGFGNYGVAYTAAFSAHAGDTVRVWIYSPATPGYVVVDDATLIQDFGSN
jgi:hypothetical protein